MKICYFVFLYLLTVTRAWGTLTSSAQACFVISHLIQPPHTQLLQLRYLNGNFATKSSLAYLSSSDHLIQPCIRIRILFSVLAALSVLTRADS